MNYKICRIETLEELIEEHRNISQKVSVYEFDETSYTLLLIEINKVLKENKKLKEQLEDMTLCRDIASGHRKEVQDRETILLNQQKEFIEYIASYIELLNDKPDLVESSQKDVLEEILSKYKEIIGGDK